jgi:RNA polymerase sigma-70 factor (ECF subfamily)
MSYEAIDGLLDERAKFLRFIERRISNPSVAEDLLQNAYLRAFSSQTALHSEESAVAWFYRILRNAIIDYRHRAVEERVLDPWNDDAETATVAPGRATNVCSCIHGALDRIQPAYREVLREVDLTGDARGSLNNFADKAGITTGNAAVRAHRARRALKQQLLHTCGACTQTGCLDCTCD